MHYFSTCRIHVLTKFVGMKFCDQKSRLEIPFHQRCVWNKQDFLSFWFSTYFSWKLQIILFIFSFHFLFVNNTRIWHNYINQGFSFSNCIIKDLPLKGTIVSSSVTTDDGMTQHFQLCTKGSKTSLNISRTFRFSSNWSRFCCTWGVLSNRIY